jgi:hypothetical protein
MTTTHDSLAWRTTSYSEKGEKCVEVAPTPDGAIIRHSRHPELGTISFSPEAWSRFVAEARTGRPSNNGVATVSRTDDDGAVVRSLRGGPQLPFDAGEWSAFVSGARDGEFDFHGTVPVDA